MKFEKYFQRRARQEGIGHIVEPSLKEDKNKKITIEDRLYYKYVYLDGSTIEISEETENNLDITIKKIDNTQIKLSSYLPEGWKFVSKVLDKPFSASDNEEVVNIDNIDNPKEILLILHEIGHAIIFTESSRLKVAELGFNRTFYKNENLGQESISWEERKAWAEALKLARRIKKEHSINLLDVDSFQDLQKFIHSNLLTYRYGGELFLGSNNDSVVAWLKSLFGTMASQEDIKFMEGLFDKKKLNRI